MNIYQRIADFLKRETRWYLLGILSAFVIVYNFEWGDWVRQHEGVVIAVIIALATSISIFEALAKKHNK